MADYREDINEPQKKRVVAALRTEFRDRYHVTGKKGEGYVSDEKDSPVCWVGSKYVRIEGRGELQDRLQKICDSAIRPPTQA